MDTRVGIIKRNENLKGEVFRTSNSLYYSVVTHNGVEIKSILVDDEDICYAFTQNKFKELTGE